MNVSIFHDMTCKLPVPCIFEGGKRVTLVTVVFITPLRAGRKT